MLLHEMVGSSRRAVFLGCVLAAGALLGTQREAQACGDTPVEVEALLPLDGATNVPLDAVLISSSNLTEAVFELRDLSNDANWPAFAAPVADAGASADGDARALGTVPLRVECDVPGIEHGAVCLARPLEPLKPNTRYAWRTNVVVPEGYVPEYFLGLSREFTTGNAPDDGPLAPSAVTLALFGEHYTTSEESPCGITHWLDVGYSLRAGEPAVLQFAGYTPSYVMHATLLTPDKAAAATSATLYLPPDCLSPVLYDAAGHRTALPEWCPGGTVPTSSHDADPEPESAPTPSSPSNPIPRPPNDSVGTPVAVDRERHPLCALSMPPLRSPFVAPPAAALLGVALLLAERRRRAPGPLLTGRC
jgi:hypothetical protein